MSFIKKDNIMDGSEKGYIKYLDEGKEEITTVKVIFYQMILFIPILIAIVISLVIASKVHYYFEASQSVVSQIILIPLTFIIFAIVIPFIRARENIKGVRLSLFGFLIVSFFITIPPIFGGMYEFVPRLFLFIATYILLVFIFSPEVLGMGGNIQDWFRKGKQFLIIGIYFFIIIFYILGFAWVYYEISRDPTNPNSFSKPDFIDNLSYFDMIYYSMITYATIGYGDISPQSVGARLVATLEALVGILMNVLFIAILLLYVSNYQSYSTRQEEKKIAAVEEKIEAEEQKIESEENQIQSEEAREEAILAKIKQHKI